MQLEDFYDYKNQLMQDILTNEKIVNLISDVDEDGNPLYTLENARDLAYEYVFPYEFIAETLYDGRTFIMFDVDIRKSPSKTFYLPSLYVWVFAHRSRLRLPDGGGVRTDAICSEICKAINGSRQYGLGELNIHSVERFAPATDYNGKVMTFRMKEINKVHNPMKYTPTNRKND